MSQEQKTMILEAVEQATDGLITLNELATKLEKITGGKIERTAEGLGLVA
jgi:hypothetical protein